MARRDMGQAVGEATPAWRPAVWMRALLSTAPARWPVGRSIRAALTVAGPLIVGALLGHTLVGMWISMGTLLLAAGERSVAYSARFRQFAVTTPLAAAAYFLGELSHAPHVLTVVVMGLIACVAGVLSGYSGTLSVGTMQALLIAAIAIGVPAARPYWEAAALFLVGAAISAAALGVEVLFNRRRPQQDALVGLLRALGALSRAQAQGAADLAAERAGAIAAIDAFDAMAITGRGRAAGPTAEYHRAARITRAADQFLARLLAADARRDLSAAAAARLEVCADAVARRRRPSPRPADGTLIRLAMLEAAIWDDDGETPPLPATERARLSLPGRELLATAGRLGLCTALAYAAYFTLPIAHGYWIALTVALAMKPDLGSVFSRAVLRCIGTVGGAVIAVVAGALLDEPVAVGVVIAVLAACLPWAMARSYLWQALFLTPLVMLLIDMVVPDESVRILSEARVLTTFVGGLIVIVAGYLIWPSSWRAGVATPFDDALGALAAYARDVARTADPEVVTADRRDVYRRLSDTRTTLQRTLSEPPPAGAQAWAWIPVISAAERVADRITGSSATLSRTGSGEDLSALADQLDALAGTGSPANASRGRSPQPPPSGDQSPDPEVRELADDLAHLRSLLEGRRSHTPA